MTVGVVDCFESVEVTQPYLHADMAIKERALARTTPPNSTPAATDHQTVCSRSSKPCDYAEDSHANPNNHGDPDGRSA